MTDSVKRPIAQQLATDGDVLFRWRSYMPLALLPLFFVSVADGRPATSRQWEVFCFAVALSGLAIRAFVVATAPHGTSARGTRQPTADSLSTRGAYSVVRHPLYLGSFLITLGFAVCAINPYRPVQTFVVWVLAVGGFALVYRRKMIDEEDKIAGIFGEAHSRYRQAVPMFWPDFRQASAMGRGSFDLAQAIQRQTPEYAALDSRGVFLEVVKRGVPLGREQTPEDIGHLTAFLASDAARNITGQWIAVDGGITLRQATI